MPTAPARLAALLTLALVTLTLPGCQDKFTPEVYSQIQRGMTLGEVEGILGKGELETTMGGGISAGGIASTNVTTSSTYKWEHGTKVITVTMKDGKVIDMNKLGF